MSAPEKDRSKRWDDPGGQAPESREQMSESEKYFRQKNQEKQIQGFLWLIVIAFGLYVWLIDPDVLKRWFG